MSITCGIEIRKPDPKDKSYDHHACASWKNRYFDMWLSDWLYRHARPLQTYYYTQESQSSIIPKEVLLHLADDLIHRRFDTAPEWADDVEDLGEYPVYYGEAFKELAEKVKDNEVLVYYWDF